VGWPDNGEVGFPPPGAGPHLEAFGTMSSFAAAGTLRGKVTVVTGASRGAGRGIAATLGAAGATVYVTGRSTKGRAPTENLPGTIEEPLRS
jgi:hypothetical protein